MVGSRDERRHGGAVSAVARDAAALAILRQTYRPDTVRILLVGESSPAGGTHYYYANSLLFGAIREAYVLAYGRRTPAGPAFLDFAASTGLWLVDLATTPVNNLPQPERLEAVRRGVPRLATTIRATAPDFVVACLVSIADQVALGLERSGVTAELVVLPFPSWHRQEFVRGLATTVRRLRTRASQPAQI